LNYAVIESNAKGRLASDTGRSSFISCRLFQQGDIKKCQEPPGAFANWTFNGQARWFRDSLPALSRFSFVTDAREQGKLFDFRKLDR